MSIDAMERLELLKGFDAQWKWFRDCRILVYLAFPFNKDVLDTSAILINTIILGLEFNALVFFFFR